MRHIVWLVAATILVSSSEGFIKNQAVGAVVNIIGSLIFMDMFMKILKGKNRKAIFWEWFGVITCLVSVLIDIVQLSVLYH